MVVANDLKWSEHLDRMVGKANRILGLLKRTFEITHPKMWKELYVSLLRLHLEYAVQAWNSHLQGGIDKIEIQFLVSKYGIPESQLVLRN